MPQPAGRLQDARPASLSMLVCNPKLKDRSVPFVNNCSGFCGGQDRCQIPQLP
jgi:hypothetical protein